MLVASQWKSGDQVLCLLVSFGAGYRVTAYYLAVAPLSPAQRALLVLLIIGFLLLPVIYALIVPCKDCWFIF